jgi:hypothetical protein
LERRQTLHRILVHFCRESIADSRDQPANRLRLEQVLDRLARLSRSQNKVLILDATQIDANWPLGMLHNDFARELDKLEPRIADIPNLVVLSASGPDQRSWSSDAWRQTAFTHFLIEGMKGAAGQEGNPRINLWDLFQYLRPNVTSWAWSNRQAWQTPVLLPSGSSGEQRARAIDVALAGPYSPPDPQQLPVFQAPPELTDAWARCERLAAQVPPPAAYTPALWRRYRDGLLRYEQLVVSGAGEPATRMAGRLYDMEQEIRRSARLELTSCRSSRRAVGEIAPDNPSPALNRLNGQATKVGILPGSRVL